MGDEVEAGPSPTDRSRIWVAEEGEVFRKGTVLLGPEEMEGEYDGEELRRELLEAMVERPPPRPLTDEFGLEITPLPPEQEPRVSIHSPLQSPTVQSQGSSQSPAGPSQIPDARMYHPPGAS
ncbi:hypothetical protein AX14_003577 [Amanita brunnescens Koide BX004]|nr:hypothetical protein AX14_003577 [Amanita brunnescens Koide BX004]